MPNMQPIRNLSLAGILFAFVSTLGAAEKFSVAGYAFAAPKEWKASPPSSSMRKAQFAAPGKSGEPAEVVFFHFGPGGAGGVKANVDRWMGQFQNPQNKRSKTEKVGGVNVTYAEATGTFMSGRPFGPKTAKKGFALYAAIIEGKQGAIFVKMTGPQATVGANAGKLRAMVAGALK